MNRFLFLLVCVIAVIGVVVACSAAPGDGGIDLPPDIQAALDADTSQRSADESQAKANRDNATAASARAFATAARRSTDEVLEMERLQATRSAAQETAQAQSVITQKTEQAAARQTDDKRDEIAKTEQAQARREKGTEQAQAASDQATAQAHESETASAIMLRNQQTAEARTGATATWVAGAPTRIYVAQVQAAEQNQQQSLAAIAAARQAKELELAPLRATWDIFWFPTFVSLVLFVIVAALAGGVWALLRYLDARTLERVSKVLTQLVITDKQGNVVAFITKDEHNQWELKPRDPPRALPAPTGEQSIEDAPETAREIGEVNPLLLDGDIHYTSIKAFAREIIADGDWSQPKWRNATLPRNFVMSMDSGGKMGGYARMLRLFTRAQLIIDRVPGAKGRWNPNIIHDGNIDLDYVMGVLYGEIPMPPLPEPDVPAPKKRTRTKRELTANPT